ncbi:hypothetical protein EXIGLDRAFT_654984, partial [Exidia glandulosa HHB12029]
MRRLIVLSSIALSALSTSLIPSHRKTLSFGPRLRHAKFVTTPWSPQPPLDDPHEIAFALAAHLHPRAEYHLRDDSYTDTLSGISHIYLQQYINGLTVLNGKLNANIKDGVVLSYGESFFNATNPPNLTVPVDVHTEFCSDFGLQLAPQFFLAQAPLSPDDPAHEHMETAIIRQDTCARLKLASSTLPRTPVDARMAAIYFVIHATSRDELANALASDLDLHLRQPTVLHQSITNASQWSHFVQGVPDTTEPVKARLALIQTPSRGPHDSHLHYAWELLVHMDQNTYEVAMSITSPPMILSVIDRVSDLLPHASLQRMLTVDAVDGPHVYRVFPWDVNDPDSGSRKMLTVDADRVASPRGWHFIPIDHGSSEFHAIAGHGPRMSDYRETTLGNNVFAQEWWERPSRPLLERLRPISSTPWPSLTFNYTYAPEPQENRTAEAQKHINASITQLWYTANVAHDLFYRYGFDEIAGNFQQHNFGRGGKEHDAVIINAQDYRGYNGSSFERKPDGENPVCKIHLWGTRYGTVPYNDGAFEADLVLHELVHGLSGRLVGGPADVSCLAGAEAGGLSEGWSDFVTLVVRTRPTYRDLAIGVWASQKPGGIRSHPYSLNHTTNPATYKYLDHPEYSGLIHPIGEVWANILWGVLHRLIGTHGINPSLFPPEDPDGFFYRLDKGNHSVPRHGNTLALRLMIDSMKLLPCNPTFLDARNALLQADKHLTEGENTCDIWCGFAERGLGIAARV